MEKVMISLRIYSNLDCTVTWQAGFSIYYGMMMTTEIIILTPEVSFKTYITKSGFTGASMLPWSRFLLFPPEECWFKLAYFKIPEWTAFSRGLSFLSLLISLYFLISLFISSYLFLSLFINFCLFLSLPVHSHARSQSSGIPVMTFSLKPSQRFAETFQSRRSVTILW